MKIENGFSFYGQKVGVLVFKNNTPRIPGDAGHAESFNYPVCFEIIDGSFNDLVVGSDIVKQNIINGCKKLKKQGVKAVIADCGMMSLYQDVIAKEADVIFAGSSLVQLPLIWNLISRNGKIGIITGHSKMLGEQHLISSGWSKDIDIVIQGMEEEKHFSEIVIEGGHHLDIEMMREDVLNATRKLLEKDNNIKAIILECSNLPTYAKDIQENYDLPVFDIISTANLIRYGICPTKYI